MDIFKAIKKEKKFLKKFYIVMALLGIILPLAVYLTGIKTPFYLLFLLTIEILISAQIISKINLTKLKYSCSNNRFKCKLGLLSKESLIFCDKVVLIHTEKIEEDMEIIIITSVNFKNKKLKPVINKIFLRKYPESYKELMKVSSKNSQNLLYYQVIRRGGLKKYMLLDCLYKNCVKALYTEQCIQNIKIARGQTLV